MRMIWEHIPIVILFTHETYSVQLLTKSPQGVVGDIHGGANFPHQEGKPHLQEVRSHR